MYPFIKLKKALYSIPLNSLSFKGGSREKVGEKGMDSNWLLLQAREFINANSIEGI